MTRQTIILTDQQQAVVSHNHGPALVFAVAGAGKTTAMVHRIARLVEKGVFAPGRILATSFGRANVRDLRQALAPWPRCARVDVRTLHSLGRNVIVCAQRYGYWTHLRLQEDEQGAGSLEQRLLTATIAEARKQNAPYKAELEGLDRQDFLDYVGYNKGNLRYADFSRVDLPQPAKQIAGQAPAPSEPLAWYLDLYRLFEHIRVQQGAITFDDMLLTGWEILATCPEVLDEVQRLYQCVIVDEFQDVNLAQSEILDLITFPHRNYMVVGDDDQTIYEWRGADPTFILEFHRRYGGQRYLISDNFRSPAAPLVLANNVIAHNQRRAAKRLNLTCGFGGETQVYLDDDMAGMSRHIVGRIQSMAQAGRPLRDMAVLVRLNAQTPHIEQSLIATGIPYRVSKPFYERTEIRTLIDYGRLAWIQRQLQEGKAPLSNGRTRNTFIEAWRNVCNRPKRYIGTDLREQMQTAILRQSRPLSDVIWETAQVVSQEWLRNRLESFAQVIAWLSGHLDEPAQPVLLELEARLGFQEYLRQNSGFPQTGEGRAASVSAFIEYARGQGALGAFLQHIRQLAYQKIGQDSAGQDDAVTLSTIHQAKGLEWSVVFVAGCNQETMPFDAGRQRDLEEERRLFYVALTRTRQHLYLHALKTEPLSQFLHEACYRQVLPQLEAIEAILARDPATWQAADALALARQIPALGLERYFTTWYPPEEGEAVIQAMHRFFTAVRYHKLLPHLHLEPAHLDWWPPAAAPATWERQSFPGLEELLPGKVTWPLSSSHSLPPP